MTDRAIPLITFKELSEARSRYFEIFDEDGLVEARSINLSSFQNLLFENKGKKGGRYKVHEHDCKEICRVYEGAVLFKSGGREKIITEGQEIIFSPYVPHEAKWIEDGVMFVEFIKVYAK